MKFGSLFILLVTMKPGVYLHTCRNSLYLSAFVTRFPVPDEFVFWTKEYPDYDPPEYTSLAVHGRKWADLEIGDSSFKPKWNSIDKKINRVSFHGNYTVNKGYPLNPFGRTGLRGRSFLGRWGPNHAADPIVTRWKRNELGETLKNQQSGKGILQMVAIQRQDNKKWAIPGGMVDPGENVSLTLKREFTEEALDNPENKHLIDDFFVNGTEIYKGYVDDYRNTDNAWIETIACNFHDNDGTKVGRFKLTAGDDAANVRWMDIDQTIQLHANHGSMVEKVAEIHGAHW